MIELPEGSDRGKEIFKKFPHAITNMVLNHKTQYFGSTVYSALKNNCRVMDMYIDQKYGGFASNVSNISPQIIRKSYHDFVALFQKFFESDPFFSVRRSKTVTPDDERIVTSLLSENAENTSYREECFDWTVDHVTRYGTACTYSFAINDYGSNELITIPQETGFGDTSYIQEYKEGSPAFFSIPIHPLNAIVDPGSNFMTPPDYKGILADICVSNLALLRDNDNYNQKELEAAIDTLKSGYPDEYWYNGEYNEAKDYSKGHGSIMYLWTRLPFEGNEDDPTVYAIEEVAGEIIRIEENILDNNTIPVAISKVFPRQYEWFGNSPLVDKISMQNLQHWTINTFVESTAKAMDRIILYKKGAFNEEALSARHQSGGLLPYDGDESDLSKVMYAPQFNSGSFREIDWLMQYSRREDQDSSSIPSFNPQSEGGPTNRTLGGAQMMASIGEMRMSKHVISLAKGQREVGSNIVSLMKNVLPDESPEKASLVKSPVIDVKTSNVFNYVRDAIESGNRLTQAINFLKTGIPQFQGIKLEEFIKDWIRASTKNDDIDSYYDPQAVQMQQGQEGLA